MGMEPCDVGPMVVLFDDPIEVIGLDNPAHPAFGLKRHRPAGIEPVAERDERAQRRAAERNLMDFYDRLPTYISACDAMKPAIVPHAEAGEIFARLIGRG